MDRWGSCKQCGKENRWSYSGRYRASYCASCDVTYLEQFDEMKNLWVSEKQEKVKA